MFEAFIGSVVLILANALYIDMKRKGKGGFSRFILFWLGIPITFLWLFLVREGTVEEIEERPDDADALLAEIRRDRALRGGAGEPLPPGGGSGEGFFGRKEPHGPGGPGGA